VGQLPGLVQVSDFSEGVYMVILDVGSGNTCGNDLEKVKDMIDAIDDIRGDSDVTIKWQLFLEAPPNVPLKRDVFRYAYEYAEELGIPTTASVFSIDDLAFLMDFDPPFVKLACRPELYKIARHITDRPIVVSYPSDAEMGKRDIVKPLCCVRKYPARIEEYERGFKDEWLSRGISDHTIGFELYFKYQPEIYEKHFVLRHDKNNPDGGPFAATPKDLEAIL